MIIEKISYEVSPPKLSIHWAGASAEDIKESERQKKLLRDGVIEEAGNNTYTDELGWGYLPSEAGSVWILFGDKALKLWPHEFSIVTPESFKLYIWGEDDDGFVASHLPRVAREFVISPHAEVNLELAKRYGFSKDLYEYALLETDEIHSFWSSMGFDPDDPLNTVSKNFWFSLHPIYFPHLNVSEEESDEQFGDSLLENIKHSWTD